MRFCLSMSAHAPEGRVLVCFRILQAQGTTTSDSLLILQKMCLNIPPKELLPHFHRILQAQDMTASSYLSPDNITITESEGIAHFSVLQVWTCLSMLVLAATCSVLQSWMCLSLTCLFTSRLLTQDLGHVWVHAFLPSPSSHNG